MLVVSGVRGKHFGRGFQGYGRPRGGSGCRAPGRRRIFENLKRFLKKIEKCIILAYFTKKFQTYALNFCAFGRITIFLGKFLRKLSKFLMKIQ